MKKAPAKKERVLHRYFTDGVRGEERYYLMAVYQHADGSEYINQKLKTPIKRENGVPVVEMHAKTIRAMSGTQFLEHVKKRAQGRPIVLVVNPVGDD